jgi:hypothetical protein
MNLPAGRLLGMAGFIFQAMWPAPVGKQQTDPNCNCHTTRPPTIRPANTAGQDIDPLQEPDSAARTSKTAMIFRKISAISSPLLL